MKKLNKKQLEMLESFHWQAMVEFGPDRHCDGSSAILYGVLKLLDYDVPFTDPYKSKEEVDKLILEIKETEVVPDEG